MAGLKDIFNCELVRLFLRRTNDKDLVIRALDQAVSIKKPGCGLIHHSDRGSQYCSHEYRKRLTKVPNDRLHESQRQLLRIISDGKFSGVPWKTSWSITVHTEQGGSDQRKITSTLKSFTTAERHSSLGYLSPAAFKNQNFSRMKMPHEKSLVVHYWNSTCQPWWATNGL